MSTDGRKGFKVDLPSKFGLQGSAAYREENNIYLLYKFDTPNATPMQAYIGAFGTVCPRILPPLDIL